MAVSGNINSEPIKKQSAPMKVKVMEIFTTSALGNWGGTKAKRAEIMKAIHPSKFIKVTHHEILVGFQAQ